MTPARWLHFEALADAYWKSARGSDQAATSFASFDPIAP